MCKKSEIDVLFFIEHVDREMEAAELITDQLRDRHGLKCVIASAVFHPVGMVLRTSPKIVITPSTSFGVGSAGWLFHKSCKTPPIFINLNYEQFISSWKGSYKSGKHYVSLNSQLQFTWGNYFKDFLINTGTRPENIFVTGRPLFSLLKKKYYGCNYKKELSKEFSINYFVKWNFIALTDGLAFVGDKKVNNIVKSGADEEGLRNHIKHVKETIKNIIEWVSSMEKESDELFILRPHPSISVQQYQSLIESIIGRVPKNLLLFKDHTAHKWLMSCERFFTNYSTLALDAVVLEKEFYVFQPLNKIYTEDYWWCNSGKKIKSLETFRELILRDVYSEFVERTSKERILDYIDLSKDGIDETVNEVVRVITKFQGRYKVSYLNFLIALCSAPKRLFGSMVRNGIVGLGFKSNVLVSSGLSIDYFKLNKNDL